MPSPRRARTENSSYFPLRVFYRRRSVGRSHGIFSCSDSTAGEVMHANAPPRHLICTTPGDIFFFLQQTKHTSPYSIQDTPSHKTPPPAHPLLGSSTLRDKQTVESRVTRNKQRQIKRKSRSAYSLPGPKKNTKTQYEPTTNYQKRL